MGEAFAAAQDGSRALKPGGFVTPLSLRAFSPWQFRGINSM